MPQAKSTILQEDLNRQIWKDRDDRIAEHQALVGSSSIRVESGDDRPLNLLAAGDSWFDYPPSDDVCDQLLKMLPPDSTVLKLAHHGDATTTMLGVKRRDLLVETLRDPRNGVWDGILFSGGGNDLAGGQFRLWLNDAPPGPKDESRAVNAVALGYILGVVETAYRDLMRARDLADHEIPIFIHTYDFGIPDGRGVCSFGPWLLPSFRDRGWMQVPPSQADLAAGSAIMKRVLTEFDRLIARLAGDPANNVVHVRTQNTLTASEWANELHPTSPGFQKIASVFLTALQTRLPERQIIAEASLV